MTRLEDAIRTVQAYYDRVGPDCFAYHVEHDSLPSPVSRAYKDLKFATDRVLLDLLKDAGIVMVVEVYVE